MGGIYWIASYPKSGNTWFRTFLKNYLEDGDQPVDINDISTGGIASSRGWLDGVLGFDTADLYQEEVDRLRPAVYKWSLCDDVMSYHKIHDAYTITTDNVPLVSFEATIGGLYLIRNPLDIVVSYSNHNQNSIDDTIKLMGDSGHALCGSRNKITNQTRQKLLSWSDHALSWTETPGLNCYIVRYEDMVTNPVETFTGAIKFLGLPLTQQRIEKAIRFSQFSVLRNQEESAPFKEKPPQVKFFFRSGKIGEWKNILSPDQIHRVIADHGSVMKRFGYLNDAGEPI